MMDTTAFYDNDNATTSSEDDDDVIQPDLWPHLLLMGLVVTGVAGNSTVMAAIRRNIHLHRTFYLLVLSLAVCDLVRSAVLMPLVLTHTTLEGLPLSLPACQSWNLFDFLTASITATHMVLLAYHLHNDITSPMHRLRDRAKAVSGAWMGGSLLATPAVVAVGLAREACIADVDKVLLWGSVLLYTPLIPAVAIQWKTSVAARKRSQLAYHLYGLLDAGRMMEVCSECNMETTGGASEDEFSPGQNSDDTQNTDKEHGGETSDNKCVHDKDLGCDNTAFSIEEEQIRTNRHENTKLETSDEKDVTDDLIDQSQNGKNNKDELNEHKGHSDKDNNDEQQIHEIMTDAAITHGFENPAFCNHMTSSPANDECHDKKQNDEHNLNVHENEAHIAVKDELNATDRNELPNADPELNVTNDGMQYPLTDTTLSDKNVLQVRDDNPNVSNNSTSEKTKVNCECQSSPQRSVVHAEEAYVDENISGDDNDNALQTDTDMSYIDECSVTGINCSVVQASELGNTIYTTVQVECHSCGDHSTEDNAKQHDDEKRENTLGATNTQVSLQHELNDELINIDCNNIESNNIHANKSPISNHNSDLQKTRDNGPIFYFVEDETGTPLADAIQVHWASPVDEMAPASATKERPSILRRHPSRTGERKTVKFSDNVPSVQSCTVCAQRVMGRVRTIQARLSMLRALCVVFAVGTLPYTIVVVALHHCAGCGGTGGTLALRWISLATSVVNPLLYTLMDAKLRTAILRLFCR